MYLTINGVQHTVTRRIVTGDTIKYLGVTPEPKKITGTIQMYRNDGFLMSEDNTANYARHLFSGTLLQITNKPAPETAPFVPAPEQPRATVVTAVVG